MLIEIPNHDDIHLELTEIVSGGTARQLRWTRAVLQALANKLGSEQSPNRKSYVTDETEVVVGKVVEVVNPQADNRLAMQAGLDVVLNKLNENGVAQFAGIFTRDETVIATFKATFGTVVPSIPSPWPKLPRIFPLPDDREHKLVIKIPSLYGDGWDLRHGVAALDEIIKTLLEHRGVQQISVGVTTLDFDIDYYPGPSHDRTTIVVEIAMFEAMRELVRQHGMVEADFEMMEVTYHLLGYGWIRFLG